MQGNQTSQTAFSLVQADLKAPRPCTHLMAIAFAKPDNLSQTHCPRTATI